MALFRPYHSRKDEKVNQTINYLNFIRIDLKFIFAKAGSYDTFAMQPFVNAKDPNLCDRKSYSSPYFSLQLHYSA